MEQHATDFNMLSNKEEQHMYLQNYICDGANDLSVI